MLGILDRSFFWWCGRCWWRWCSGPRSVIKSVLFDRGRCYSKNAPGRYNSDFKAGRALKSAVLTFISLRWPSRFKRRIRTFCTRLGTYRLTIWSNFLMSPKKLQLQFELMGLFPNYTRARKRSKVRFSSGKAFLLLWSFLYFNDFVKRRSRLQIWVWRKYV